MSVQKKGFTLIELMLVVSIVGILASIAVPSFIRYVKLTKKSESFSNLKALGDGAASYYEVDHYTEDGKPVDEKQFPTPSGNLIDTNASKLPDFVPRGTKYASTAIDWNTQPWLGLKFQIIKPQYYRYRYFADNNDPALPDFFTAWSEGDIDADTETSRFGLSGVADPSGGISLSAIFSYDSDNDLE